MGFCQNIHKQLCHSSPAALESQQWGSASRHQSIPGWWGTRDQMLWSQSERRFHLLWFLIQVQSFIISNSFMWAFINSNPQLRSMKPKNKDEDQLFRILIYSRSMKNFKTTFNKFTNSFSSFLLYPTLQSSELQTANQMSYHHFSQQADVFVNYLMIIESK